MHNLEMTGRAGFSRFCERGSGDPRYSRLGSRRYKAMRAGLRRQGICAMGSSMTGVLFPSRME